MAKQYRLKIEMNKETTFFGEFPAYNLAMDHANDLSLALQELDWNGFVITIQVSDGGGTWIPAAIPQDHQPEAVARYMFLASDGTEFETMEDAVIYDSQANFRDLYLRMMRFFNVESSCNACAEWLLQEYTMTPRPKPTKPEDIPF